MRSLRSIAKILGTVCCVSGALTMALLKGQKLLHMEFLPSTHLTASGSENWVLGCLLLLASSVFWSCWMIMQVNNIKISYDLINVHQWKFDLTSSGTNFFKLPRPFIIHLLDVSLCNNTVSNICTAL